MKFATYTEAKELLDQEEIINFDNSFDLAKLCSQLLRNPEQESLGRDLAIRALDALDRIDSNSQSIWNDIIDSAGLYPYVDPTLLGDGALIRLEYHRSRFLPDRYFHEEQNNISLNLSHDESIILSAPTSFGKSLLIEEIVASQRHKNIVIIQPTLALLDETRKKLAIYREQYKVIVSTSQIPDDDRGNIFLFTAERVVEYKSFHRGG